MKKLTVLGTIVIASGLLLGGCDDKGAQANKDTSAAATAKKADDKAKSDKAAKTDKAAKKDDSDTKAAVAKAGDVDLSTPKKSIETQLKLLQEGKLNQFKACFTDRQKDKINEEMFNKAKGQAAKMKIEELFDKSEDGKTDGKKTAKVKMKNGRTLTTLILTDKKWLADTLWFK